MYVNGAIIAMIYTHLIRIINNNNNRPPACILVLPYGTGSKVSRNDGLIMKSTKCKPSAEFGGWYIRIFGLKTPCMHMY